MFRFKCPASLNLLFYVLILNLYLLASIMRQIFSLFHRKCRPLSSTTRSVTTPVVASLFILLVRTTVASGNLQLSSAMPDEQRQKAIGHQNDPNDKQLMFTMTAEIGGQSLNYQFATWRVFIDGTMCFNMALVTLPIQIVGRLYRLSQTRPVEVTIALHASSFNSV
ncbi:hypothetical protein B0T26DRAFT_188129 [Lasiosphaeria miniovina]|uniref:Uncharacterized protein n=1 Tax=Lasiosphaeria miniovina TaxID=1954250 RepID=A0AA40AT79_9PEZI|nr:uncharacterized protein B0T26DRAFT_188129 [Lasiosphaeria miniovina]KAK0721588.1 hypothetical protein B0T26DRAFT_188129 [Lasiosphaeria miniovina]